VWKKGITTQSHRNATRFTDHVVGKLGRQKCEMGGHVTKKKSTAKTNQTRELTEKPVKPMGIGGGFTRGEEAKKTAESSKKGWEF